MLLEKRTSLCWSLVAPHYNVLTGPTRDEIAERACKIFSVQYLFFPFLWKNLTGIQVEGFLYICQDFVFSGFAKKLHSRPKCCVLIAIYFHFKRPQETPQTKTKQQTLKSQSLWVRRKIFSLFKSCCEITDLEGTTVTLCPCKAHQHRAAVIVVHWTWLAL